jgi:hypothetical protein
MRELFSQLWNLFHQVIYRNKFHISGTYKKKYPNGIKESEKKKNKKDVI